MRLLCVMLWWGGVLGLLLLINAIVERFWPVEDAEIIAGPWACNDANETEVQAW